MIARTFCIPFGRVSCLILNFNYLFNKLINLIDRQRKMSLKPVTEDLLYQMSDCDSLDQIEVLSFKYIEDGHHERQT